MAINLNIDLFIVDLNTILKRVLLFKSLENILIILMNLFFTSL